jgi:hypothetical protein
MPVSVRSFLRTDTNSGPSPCRRIARAVAKDGPSWASPVSAAHCEMLMVRFRLLMVTLANGVNDQVAERIDRLQELWEVVATDLKLVLTSKIAALPEEQTAALVPGDFNDVLLCHQQEAGLEPGDARIFHRVGG